MQTVHTQHVAWHIVGVLMLACGSQACTAAHPAYVCNRRLFDQVYLPNGARDVTAHQYPYPSTQCSLKLLATSLRGISAAEKGKDKDQAVTDATISALDKNARPLTKEEMKHFSEGVEKAHEGDPAEATFKGTPA